MPTLTQEQFEREVLFSVMKDAANILKRESIRPAGLMRVDTDETPWDVDFVLEYLPVFSAAVPVEETSTSPVMAGENAEYRLMLPQSSIRAALADFLEWFVDRGVRDDKFAGEARTRVSEALPHVVEDVTSMWKWIEM